MWCKDMETMSVEGFVGLMSRLILRVAALDEPDYKLMFPFYSGKTFWNSMCRTGFCMSLYFRACLIKSCSVTSF